MSDPGARLGAMAAMMAAVAAVACAQVDDPATMAPDADGHADWTWDDPPDAATDLPTDTLEASGDILDAYDSTYDSGWDVASDTYPDTDADLAPDTTLDTSPDTGVDTAPDTATDPDADPGPCAGVSHGGFCWYLGAEERSCTVTCSTHGGYNEGTRTFAGSEGTNWDCNDVLDALDAAGVSTGTLSASGAGVGCFLMNLVNDRYRVADMPTTADATYMLGRRACACNE